MNEFSLLSFLSSFVRLFSILLVSITDLNSFKRQCDKLVSHFPRFYSVQFSSVAQSCLTLCDPMNRSTPGLPVHHQLPEFTQTQRPLSQWCHPLLSVTHNSFLPILLCAFSFAMGKSHRLSSKSQLHFPQWHEMLLFLFLFIYFLTWNS